MPANVAIQVLAQVPISLRVEDVGDIVGGQARWVGRSKVNHHEGQHLSSGAAQSSFILRVGYCTDVC